MGRGTAITRYGSALHSRRFPGPPTQRLFHWLEAQLDMRGVDPALYSRYLISLLQLDDAEFERSEVSDQEFDSNSSNEGKHRVGSNGVGGSNGRRSRRKKQQQPPSGTVCVTDAAIGLASGVSSRKRAAAVQCLQSACNDPYELDELIDELCYRLKRLNAGSGCNLQQQQQHLKRRDASDRLPLLAEDDLGEASELAASPSSPSGGLQTDAAAADFVEAGYEGAVELFADSGQAGTPDEEAPTAPPAVAEDYVCAFPALAALRERASSAASATVARSSTAAQSGRSAWSRGPPRSLHRLQQQPVSTSRRLRGLGATADEGFLEGDDEEAADHLDDFGEPQDDDDDVSVTSEGSEILQLVSHILHSFNRELEDELASASASAASAGNSSSDRDPFGSSRLLPPLRQMPDGGVGVIDDAVDNCGLLTGLSLMDDEAELLSDHDFDDLPSQEEEEIPAQALIDADDDFVTDETESLDSAYAKSTIKPEPVLPPSVAMATGVVTLPADLVLGRMAQWTALDRLRCQMWSRKPLPPKPQPQLRLTDDLVRSQPSPPVRRQPMTPLEKSKRACSFLLRGRCKKEDCEFAHDLNRVICKFWSAGECFKGDTCPFLHGSPAESENGD